MKNYYRDIKDPLSFYNSDFPSTIRNSNWQERHTSTKEKDRVGFSGVNGKKSYNQATYDVLESSNASILCTSIYALEKQALSKRKIHILGIPVSMRKINKWAVTKIDKERQITALNCTGFEEYQAQVKYLLSQNEVVPPFTRRIKIADKASDFEDRSTIWIVLTAEGGHNFYGPLNSSEDSVRASVCNGPAMEEILKNVQFAKDEHRLFFVTPSHLFWNKISGYARGLDMDVSIFRKILSRQMWKRSFAAVDGKDGEGIIDTVFIPDNKTDRTCENACMCLRMDTGFKVSQLGYAFIDTLLSKKNKYNKPTYIDMRHMDVKARLDYIAYINKNHSNDDIPLIISHAAVNGKNRKMAAYLGLCPVSDNYKEFINPVKFYKKQIRNCCGDAMGLHNEQEVNAFMENAGWFHPMSNNLFDEEIEAVYTSNGIIGLTVEERALGKNTYNYKHNKHALRNFINQHKSKYPGLNFDDKLLTDMESAEPFVRNLFYIVGHSKCSEDIKSWQHIAMGTDFDGIMNPIDNCTTAAEIPGFYKFLCKTLPLYADYLGVTPLMLNKPPHELMDLLFYKNGESFIKKYF